MEYFKVTSSNLSNYCYYLAINISSPNTPYLREFHDKDLLLEVIEATKEGVNQTSKYTLIFFKFHFTKNILKSTKLLKLLYQKN